MDAIKFLKERSRMTKCGSFGCTITCEECPLSEFNNTKGLMCDELQNCYPKECVEIVENWSKEHPIKTRQSELLKMFPNIPMSDGVIELSPCELGEKDEKCDICSDCVKCRKKYWLEEI